VVDDGDEIKRDTSPTDMSPKISRRIATGRDCLPPPPSVPNDILQALDWVSRAHQLIEDMIVQSSDTIDPATVKCLCNQVMIHKVRVDGLYRALSELVEDLEDHHEAETKKMGTIE
jgi:hypothetical protein